MSKMLKQTSTPTSNSDRKLTSSWRHYSKTSLVENVDYNDAEDDVECFFRNDEVVDISSDDDVVDSDDDGVDENYIQVPQDFNSLLIGWLLYHVIKSIFSFSLQRSWRYFQ